MKYQFKIREKEYQFQIVKFYSLEEISEIYEYQIELITKSEIEDVLMQEAVFSIEYLKFTDKINGIIAEFEEISKIDEFFYYRIKLVPKIYQLTLNKYNKIFLNKSLIDIFSELLKQYRLEDKIDYEFKLINEYKKQEYITQYLESDFNFIKRWCEKLGIYFYFEQGDKEKIIFIDNKLSQKNFDYNNQIYYSTISGVEGDEIYKSAQNITIIKKNGIKEIKIKDYNPNKPDYNLEITNKIDEIGKDIYIYGEHFQSKMEGDKLAQIIGEAYDVQREVFEVNSTIPNIYVGYNYLLTNHYKKSLNDKSYFILKVKKRGSGDTFLNDKINLFRSEFSMVDSNRQYRSLFKTSKEKIKGILLAKIDGDTKKTPYLDDKGRYKVIMPFILNSNIPSKVSCWIRLLQPTGGGDKGFHFPLQKNTEVAISFINGDPDRPIILGALSNPNNPNVVSLENAEQNILQSQKQMKLILDDNDDEPFIEIISKDGSSHIKIT